MSFAALIARKRGVICDNQACQNCGLRVREGDVRICRYGKICLQQPIPPMLPIWVKVLLLVASISSASLFVVHRQRIAWIADHQPIIRSISVSPTQFRGEPWEAFATCERVEGAKFQWYLGFPGDVTSPVFGANSEKLNIARLQERARYWLRMSNEFGQVDSDGIEVIPTQVDTTDLARELDELLSFSRTVLEQTQAVIGFEDLARSVATSQNPDESERKRYLDLQSIAQTKLDRHVKLLVDKAIALRSGSSHDRINQLFDTFRPPPADALKFESERLRKSFSLAEEAWRAARDNHPLSIEQIKVSAANKMPL